MYLYKIVIEYNGIRVKANFRIRNRAIGDAGSLILGPFQII